MSYPVNTEIVYDAVPYTRGFTPEDHTVTWTFSDSTTFEGQETTKTWNTVGAKPFTVNAICNPTNTTATISRTIYIDTFTWTTYVTGTDLPAGTWYPICASLSDGAVMSIGGQGGNTYILTNKTWTTVASPTYPRSAQSCQKSPQAIELSDGGVLVVGATRTTSDKKCEIYHRATNTWTSTGDMVTGVSYSCYPIKLRDGRVVVFGGGPYATTPYINSYQQYDESTGTWSQGNDILTPFRYSVDGQGNISTFTLTTSWFNSVLPPIELASGDVFFVSPTVPIIAEVVSVLPTVWKNELSYKCFVFHPADDTFTLYETRSSAFNISWSPSCVYAQATDGYVYVFGYNSSGSNGYIKCMRIHPDLGVYEPIADAPHNLQFAFAAMPIMDGTKIHVIGSSYGSSDQRSVVFNTVTGAWEQSYPFYDPAHTLASERGYTTMGGNPLLFGGLSAPTQVFNGN